MFDNSWIINDNINLNLWYDFPLVYWTATSAVAEDSTPTLHFRWRTVTRRKPMSISLGCWSSLLNCFLTWKLQKEICSSTGVPLRLAAMDKRRASGLVLMGSHNNCLLFLVCHSFWISMTASMCDCYGPMEIPLMLFSARCYFWAWIRSPSASKNLLLGINLWQWQWLTLTHVDMCMMIVWDSSKWIFSYCGDIKLTTIHVTDCVNDSCFKFSMCNTLDCSTSWIVWYGNLIYAIKWWYILLLLTANLVWWIIWFRTSLTHHIWFCLW